MEGVLNEHIVAVGVYYYDAINVSESRLRFRQKVDADGLIKWDDKGVRAVCGLVLGQGRALNQLLGTVVTKSDRCIAFPNALWKRVTPFRLVDPKRGGVLRSLAFLLVDPSVRIASTADVPPQQREWLEREMLSPVGALRCLPEVLVREVMAYVGGVTPQQARKHRERLVAERRAIVRELSARVTFMLPSPALEPDDGEDDDHDYSMRSAFERPLPSVAFPLPGVEDPWPSVEHHLPSVAFPLPGVEPGDGEDDDTDYSTFERPLPSVEHPLPGVEPGDGEKVGRALFRRPLPRVEPDDDPHRTNYYSEDDDERSVGSSDDEECSGYTPPPFLAI